MKYINKFPDELVNNIMIIYWQNIFKNNVINKINIKNSLFNKIYQYMLKHGIPNILLGFGHPTDKHHYYYYKDHNNIILSYFYLKSNKKNNLLKYQLSFYNNMYYIIDSGMLNNVLNPYKYICSFYIINYFQFSSQILKYFEKMSKIKNI